MISFKMLLDLIFLCRSSEVVKRARLKISSLSEFGGSNPLSCMFSLENMHDEKPVSNNVLHFLISLGSSTWIERKVPNL